MRTLAPTHSSHQPICGLGWSVSTISSGYLLLLYRRAISRQKTKDLPDGGAPTKDDASQAPKLGSRGARQKPEAGETAWSCVCGSFGERRERKRTCCCVWCCRPQPLKIWCLYDGLLPYETNSAPLSSSRAQRHRERDDWNAVGARANARVERGGKARSSLSPHRLDIGLAGGTGPSGISARRLSGPIYVAETRQRCSLTCR